MYELAKNDRQVPAKSEASDDRRFAQPPPAEQAAPPVAVAQAAPAEAPLPAPAGQAGVAARDPVAAREEDVAGNGIVAESKARQQQRTMDELERGELVQTAGPGESSGYADKAAEKDTHRAGPLLQVYEQIRSGRCVQARELLHKLERSLPGTVGLSDANLAWQKDCGGRQLQNVQQQNLPYNLSNQAQPSRSSAPVMPSPAPPAPRLEKMQVESQAASSRDQMDMRRAMNKKSAAPAPIQKAPAKAKAAKAAAADAAF